MALRNVTEADLPILFEQQREPEANRMAAFPARDYDAFMAHWRQNVLGNAGAQTKAIIVDDVLAGNVGSWAQDGQRLVSYWIAKAYWGRGVATAALGELLADHERTRPIFAYVATRNVGSIRVLEKCGFVPAGAPATHDDGVEEVLMRLG